MRKLVKRTALKILLDDYLEKGIIEPSSSNWASPIHMVKKNDNSFRVCGDYRLLNNHTQNDMYPVPHIQDCNSDIINSRIFSRMDLERAYHQIPMNEDDICKTAIITPFGLFHFLRMPFGLKTAAQTFQRFIDNILRNTSNNFRYIDDILIFSDNEKDHQKHIQNIKNKLDEFGIIINSKKSEFNKLEIDFLGYTISQNSIQPRKSRLETIKNWPTPETENDLRKFLGLVNFYHRFIPNVASLTKSLHDLILSRKKSHRKITLNKNAEENFIKIKELFYNQCILTHPIPDAPLSIWTDASDNAIGAVLHQWVDNHYQPLAFFSKALKDAQLNYSTFGKELYAAKAAVKHFRAHIEGRNIKLYTDHKTLALASKKASIDYLPKEIKHLQWLNNFGCEIIHVKGENNEVADALSRLKVNMIQVYSYIDYKKLERLQQEDEKLKRLAISPDTMFTYKTFTLPDSTVKLICQTDFGMIRPCIPNDMIKEIISAYHDRTHPGIKATRRTINIRFYWPKITPDVEKYVKNCIQCQLHKHRPNNISAVTPIAVSKERLKVIHIDLLKMKTNINGYQELLTIIDRTTRIADAIPLKSIDTDTICTKLINNWFKYRALPAEIISDNGTQFASLQFKQFCHNLGIKKTFTTTYHPQSNGMIERFHQKLRASVEIDNKCDNWLLKLPWAIMQYNNTYREHMKGTPNEYLFGMSTRIPPDLVIDDNQVFQPTQFLAKLYKTMNSLVPIQTDVRNYILPTIDSNLFKAKFVFVENKQMGSRDNYQGPYRVLESDHKWIKLMIGNRPTKVSIDRCKVAHLPFYDSNEPYTLSSTPAIASSLE